MAEQQVTLTNSEILESIPAGQQLQGTQFGIARRALLAIIDLADGRPIVDLRGFVEDISQVDSNLVPTVISRTERIHDIVPGPATELPTRTYLINPDKQDVVEESRLPEIDRFCDRSITHEQLAGVIDLRVASDQAARNYELAMGEL